MAQCAGTVKKISLELGGNAPFIVFDDADLDAAVDGAIACKYRNTGQTCVCANRILVQDGVYDEFVARFDRAVARSRSATASTPACQVGPLIDEAAVEKVERHVADAMSPAARVLDRRRRHALGGHVLRADGATGVTSAMAMSCARRRSARCAADPAFAIGAGGGRARERHAVRPRRRISTAATSAASGASPRRSNTASSASTPASSPPRWRRSAA